MAHPLEDSNRNNKSATPCILVIFGATGDLTARKLVPALYNLALDGQLPAQFACVGFARREKSHEAFRQEMLEAAKSFSRQKPIDEALWKTFSEKMYYFTSEFDDDKGYQNLDLFLKDLDNKLGTRGNRVFYLSTQPSFFPQIVTKLSDNKLIYNPNKVLDKWSRVIIEKPFGRDILSAMELQSHIERYLDESQIYRIDHYLGKETVQNLLVFRFANSIFESLWNNHHIEQVQITCSEELGIGSRGNFWEEAGMLRDIVQNHMMQILSLVAMEPPVNLDANSIRDEKVKVVQSIRAIPMDELSKYAVRGQYGPGFVNGQPVLGYRQESNVHPESSIETYAALKLYIDNWRWAGVPFYLRAGKRMPKRATEIAITFKQAPGILFHQNGKGHKEPNVLVIRIQPDEGISLKINCKIPGFSSFVQPVTMDFRYGSYFGSTQPEAYERLICDCMQGDSTLFARCDEVIASWKLLTPILHRWSESKPADFPNYAAGTWGPTDAERLLMRDHHAWRLI
ncbi:MAG: zwf [Chlamydiales bacterium]|nr:zwf [Chlamydiales bacterium]